MLWLYYIAVITIRLLTVSTIVFVLSSWFVFVFSWIKTTLSTYETNPNCFSLARTLKSIFKYKPFARPALYRLNLVKNFVFFTGAVLFFIPIPFGRIIITFSDLHPSLAGVNLLHFADLSRGIPLLLIPIYSAGLLGIDFTSSDNFSKKLSKERILQLFFPASLCLTFSLLSVSQATGTLSPAEIVAFQAREGWIIFYQLPSFLIFISVIYLFHFRFFTARDARKLNILSAAEDYAAASVLLSGSKKIYVAGINSLVVLIFFGGWLAPLHGRETWGFFTSIPGIEYLWGPFWFFLKITILYFIFSLAKLSFVNIPHNKAKSLLWKGGVVLSLANYILTVLLTEYFSFDGLKMVLLSFIVVIATLLFINFNFSVPSGQSVELKK